MGEFKPLLPFGPASIVETTVGSALAAGCRVILVVGYRGAELASLFAGRSGVLVAENPDWELGMLGSLQTGLRRVESPWFFTLPADMPLVLPAVYDLLHRARMAGSAAAAPEPAAYFASHEGRAGHPVLIPSAWIPEMLGLPPGGRMRGFLEKRRMVLVEAGTEAVHLDLDLPIDYRRTLEELGPS